MKLPTDMRVDARLARKLVLVITTWVTPDEHELNRRHVPVAPALPNARPRAGFRERRYTNHGASDVAAMEQATSQGDV